MCAEFSRFIAKHLTTAAGRLKTKTDCQQWYKSRGSWTKRVVAEWIKSRSIDTSAERLHLKRKSAAKQLRTFDNRKFVNHRAVVNIPEFDDMVAFGRSGTVVSITVAARKSKPDAKRNTTQVYLGFTSVLTPENIRRQRPMGKEFGICKRWVGFVEQYVRYATLSWRSMSDGKKWYKHEIVDHTFRKQLNALYRESPHGVKEEHRFWKVDLSTIAEDPQAGLKGFAGCGLFCTVKGKHHIYFAGIDSGISERVNHIINPVTNTQGLYQVSSDPSNREIVDVPKAECLLCTKVISIGYMVNHRLTCDNPTHTLGFCKEKKLACLIPLREAEVNEEFSFDYHYDGQVDVPTRPDPKYY